MFFNFSPPPLRKCIYVNAESLKIRGQFCDDILCLFICVYVCVCVKARSSHICWEKVCRAQRSLSLKTQAPQDYDN